MGEHTIIVGGGLAGLAAAVALAERQVPITLLESRARLGGRASSFVDNATGEVLDNCQHVAMGCCTNLQHFCRTVGTDHLFRTERELTFIGPHGEVSRFQASRWPAPAHLAPALLKLRHLSLRDKRSIARGLRALARFDPSTAVEQSFLDWLQQHRQSPAAIEYFWHVVLVSALSETLDRVDIGHARKVFVDGFLAHRRGWEVGIPTVPLDELYGTRVIDWLTRRGAVVRLNANVEVLEAVQGQVQAAKLRHGGREACGEFILAVPQHRVLDLLPPEWHAQPALRALRELQTAPISSVHLWFDRPITELPHAVFVGRLSQWVFNRSQLQARDGHGRGAAGVHRSSPPGCYYQVVISASRDVRDRPQSEVIAAVVRDLAEAWPQAGAARLLRSRVVTEHRAVFSVTPGVDQLRPAQQSPIPNLQLAGDWTRTGWPATMEGAVRSGYLAAENVLARLGRPQTVLQPDLPVAWLSRWLLGLKPPA